MTQLIGPDRVRASGRVAAICKGWQDVVVRCAGIDPTRFQIGFGAAGLKTSDGSGFHRYSDIVPARSKMIWFDKKDRNTRSGAYLVMLHALLPCHETGLRGILGDRYRSWIACRNAHPQGGEQSQLFRVWALNNLPAARAERAVASFVQSCHDPLSLAMAAFDDPAHIVSVAGAKGRAQRLRAYDLTPEHAVHYLSAGRSVNVRFDSRPEDDHGIRSCDVAQSVAPYRYFWNRSARASRDLRRLDAKALESRITVEGRIGSIACAPVRARGWYDGFELERAWRSGDDPAVWDTDSGLNWKHFFGREGLLAQRIAQLLLVTDYSLTVTSHARYTADEVDLIRSEATGGVWPMVPMEEPATHGIRFSHNSDGTISHHLELAKGDIQILGGVLEDAPH